MKFLIDEDVPRSTADTIRDLGYEVLDVRDVGLRGTPDKIILEKAIQDFMIIVTADVGFSGLPIVLDLQ